MSGRLSQVILIVSAIAVLAGGDLRAQDRRQAVDLGHYFDAPTIRLNDTRRDTRSGIVRAQYRIEPTGRQFESVPEAARKFVEDKKRSYGWRGDMHDLRPVMEARSRGGYHIRYEQVFRDLPVFGRYVQINLSRDYQPTMVLSGYDPAVRREAVDIDPSQLVTHDAAATVAEDLLEASIVIHAARLSWFREDARLFKVWDLVVSREDTHEERRILIDAGTARVRLNIEHAFHRTGAKRRSEIARPVRESPGVRLRISSARDQLLIDGTGLVFDPDPLSSSGSSYTPPFVDSGDADIPELNAERVSVSLPDITLRDGLHFLEGPHVAIVGGGSLNYDPPAEGTPDGFQYTRASQHFEAVNAYYHIDKSQRYVQSLGFSSIARSPVSVNPRAFASDNSVYSPGQNLIQFGIGGVDDGEDAGVLWHEYGHALLESSSAGLIVTSEGQALHEGWSDYWAGSYLRGKFEQGETIRTDWETVFKWDSGDGQIWAGRTIQSLGTYPEDFRCEDTDDSNNDGCNIYQDGIIWAATLMDIYDELGKTVVDQLNLQSHAYLSPPATFPDVAEALIQADLDLFDGQHTAVLINHLGDRGFINENAYGPIITHEELASVEQLGGSVPISATVSSSTAEIDSVIVRYGSDGATGELLVLAPSTGNEFDGSLPLPSSPATVTYYIEAVDEARQRTTLPAGAPQATFQFEVGPDTVPPEIGHTPISSASTILWPPTVVASITDNLGIASAVVIYDLINQSGAVVESGSFDLNASANPGVYQGDFPVSSSMVSSGYSLHYAIEAVDASDASNMAREPSSGEFKFDIVSDGLLAEFDFENTDGGFTATGDWERGVPEYGLQIARSGSIAWGTATGDRYNASPGLSTLVLPEFHLTGVSEAHLIFWHWYDFEYEGSVNPYELSDDAALWDGGNIKVSTDGGDTWTLIAPRDGYTGSIESGTVNPLAGEPGFGGYSFGWRREIVTLPAGGPVTVRMEFGTDNLNTEQARYFAGWFLDDVSVVTSIPDDAEAPLVTGLPSAVTPVSIVDTVDPIPLTLTDNTGIARAELKVDLSKSSIVVEDVLMEQDPSNLSGFTGQFEGNFDPIPGDRIAFSVEVEDFDGNVVIHNNNGSSFIIEYRTFLYANLLGAPVPTGLWRMDAGDWIADGDGTTVPRSALLVDPITLPDNTDVIYVEIAHRFNLLTGSGGNVKLSVDDGKTWQILEPQSGYPSALIAENHAMAGEPVFDGTMAGLSIARFDIDGYAGKKVQLKLDLGAARPLDFSESWEISDMNIIATTTDEDAEISHRLSIGSNFPDPFSTQTNILYTVPESGPVKVSVYDILGRRVSVPVFSEHEPGDYTLVVSADRLAAGMYFVVVEAGGDVKTEPITVIR